MKIQTNNRLAHWQVELQELQEQTSMLNAQLPGLQSQMQQLQGYCSVNGGDRKAMQSLRQLQQRQRQIVSSINRNQRRMATLQRQIQAEYNRATYGHSGMPRQRRYY